MCIIEGNGKTDLNHLEKDTFIPVIWTIVGMLTKKHCTDIQISEKNPLIERPINYLCAAKESKEGGCCVIIWSGLRVIKKFKSGLNFFFFLKSKPVHILNVQCKQMAEACSVIFIILQKTGACQKPCSCVFESFDSETSQKGA